jgi:hypothetical protein
MMGPTALLCRVRKYLWGEPFVLFLGVVLVIILAVAITARLMGF